MPAALSKLRLKQMLAFAAKQPPAKARAFVRALCPLCCGEQKTPPLAAQHFEKRQHAITAMQSAIRRHLDYAKHETLRKIEKAFRNGDIKAPLKSADAHGVAWDLIFDREEFGDGLLASLREESATALHTAGNQLYAELGRDDPWTLPDPKAKAFLDARANKLKGVSDEIHKAIQAEVKAGLDKGESLAKISKRISDKFDDISEGRAATIASTETSAAYGFARQEGMTSAGIKYKRWLTSHLPNVRDTHAEAEEDEANQRVPIDEPFSVGGEDLMYPGDENGSPENVINCHCVSLAVEDDEEEGDEL
ncbi:MAG: phage minor head protein [Chthoniobacteraceae bacterium]|nr:phage minor head protein [Chthoniobacteraceae bacterium]